MSILDRFLPPPGSPEAIREAAGVWQGCAGRIRALADDVTARSSVLSSSWSGSSKEAFVERTWPFLHQIEAAAGDLQHCAVLLNQLADGIEAAQREYRARMVAVGATAVVGVALTVFTATLSDEAAAAAVTAELATATELATTATTVASEALSALVTQAGQFALRVIVFSGANVAGEAVGAAVAYDDGRPWAHLHLREDLEWGAIGALALPLGSAMLDGLARSGVALNGASGSAIQLGVGALSMAQADVLVRGLLHEPVDPEELAIAGLPIVGATHGNEMRVPQGVHPEAFARASALLREEVPSALGDRMYAHGSRAAGTAGADSDIDFMVRVDRETFDTLIRERFKTPNPGSAKEDTMRRAIETGKIQAGEAGLRRVRKALERELGLDVDLSVILEDGPFDRGPWIPLHEEK